MELVELADGVTAAAERLCGSGRDDRGRRHRLHTTLTALRLDVDALGDDAAADGSAEPWPC